MTWGQSDGEKLTHTTVKGVCLDASFDASFDCEALAGYFLT